MRFMMLMIPKGYETAAPGTMPDAKAVEAMMKYNESLQKAGVLLALDGLHPPSMGARVSFRGGKPKVTDGPFTETNEVLGGYWMIDVKSKAGGRRMGVALSRFGQRDHRGPPGSGDGGLPRRRSEGRGGILRDAGEIRPAQGAPLGPFRRTQLRKASALSCHDAALCGGRQAGKESGEFIGERLQEGSRALVADVSLCINQIGLEGDVGFASHHQNARSRGSGADAVAPRPLGLHPARCR